MPLFTGAFQHLHRPLCSKAFCSASFVDVRDIGGGSAKASEELGVKVCFPDHACISNAYRFFVADAALVCSQSSQEWGKDSDDAVDGAGSVLSSGALVRHAARGCRGAADVGCRSARASTMS
jgi:hypothetical protein